MTHKNDATTSATMAHPNRSDNLPSLLLQSHISASNPEAQDLSEAEMIHKDALDAAQAEHERVREAALLAFELHQLREEQKIIREREDKLKEYEREQRERDRILREQENKLRELEKEERERQRRESELAERNAKLRELRRTSAKPSPADPTPQSPNGTDPSHLESSQNAQTFPMQSSINSQPPSAQETLSISRTPSNPTVTREPIASQPQARVTLQQAAYVSQPIEPQSQPSQPITTQHQPTAGPLLASEQPANRVVAQYILPGTQQYLEIHSRLKKLRTFMTDQAKQNPELKKRMGEMRREIRKSVGQLTEGRGANRQPVHSPRHTAICVLTNFYR
jgi:nucleoporin GLE1